MTNIIRVKNIILKCRPELIALTFVLIITGLAHAYNMFHYPTYFDDEGTYIAEAWAFVTKGQLSHYTYWYDHPPLGWIQLGIWSIFTGGFSSFGTAVNSGRAYMLLLSSLSTVLIYLILKRLKVSSIVALIAVLIFGLSPLEIQLSRMVFLDNIMSFWILLSLFLLLQNVKRLKYILFSAICFGIAFLSKETAIIFIIPFVLLLYFEAHKVHRNFAISLWIAISGFIISLWVLYALIKGEFFPYGFFDNTPHVSLITTIQYQMSRTGNGSLLNPLSDIRNSINSWSSQQTGDGILLLGGVFASIFNLIIGLFKNKYYLVFPLFTISFFIFYGRGGQVYSFYLISLLPFLIINLALSLDFIYKNMNNALIFIKFKIPDFIIPTLISILLLYLGLHYRFNYLTSIETQDQTTPQIQAEQWVQNNLDKSSFIVTDDYAYVDLHYQGFSYPNPIYYWKAERDETVKSAILKNNWQNVDYILVTPSVKSDIEGFSILKTAYDHSVVIKSFSQGGNTVTINKVLNTKAVLEDSWKNYKKNFVTANGRIINPYSQNSTTSEGQSYALLHSVWGNDKKTFDLVLTWTQKNMLLDDKSLFAWWYGEKADKTSGIIDNGTATDADQDTALSLLFAYKSWGDVQYLEQAKNIITDIWNFETVEIKGNRYVVAGNWASKKENKVFTINPSYLSPYAYRIFAEVDRNHDWNSLVDTSYKILQGCSESTFGLDGSANIPPDWCALDKNGKVVQANNNDDNSTHYSYDALRTLWRIALDYQWNKEPRALSYLQQMGLWQKEWSKQQKIYASYSHNGTPSQNTESLAHYGTQLAFFSITNPDVANQIYTQKILSQWNKNGYWGDQNNYYDQNWAWFGTALYSGNLPNLWK